MKLRTLLSTTAISALSVASALAADAPVKAPPAAVFSWTGFYVGGNIGGVWGQSSFTDESGLYGPVGAAYNNDLSGVIGGFQAGYNWQAGNLILGLETDINLSSAKKDTGIVFGGGLVDTQGSQLTALGTLRGRIGVAMERTLVYATGGAAHAWLKNEIVDTFFFPPNASRSSTAWGWAVGGGIEHAFGNKWSAKIEYLYARFASESVTVPPPASYVFRFADAVSVLRVGINYRF